jgi:hypothetical protein
MPRLLAQRADAAYDCIATFQEAAGRRFREGDILRQQHQWTSAVYLMGYTVEMAVKSAVLSVDGFSPRQPVTLPDLRRLVAFGRAQYGLPQPRNLHDYTFWSLFLVQHRVALAQPYGNPKTAQEIIRRSHETYSRWRETLRYRTNSPYGHEVARVYDNARWFLAEIDNL